MPRYNIVVGRETGHQRDPRGNPCAACEIREIAVCGALEEKELGELGAIVSHVEAEPGRAILYEGDPAAHLFNVTSGAVRLSKLLPDGRRQITGFLFAGDFLGLAFNESYTYSAEAIDKAALCRFPRQELEALMERHPRMERRLLGMASNELATAQDQMLLLGRKTAREKLASFLLNLAKRAARRGQPPDSVDLPMTRTDIADYLGLTIETVSRTFTELRKQGLIELQGPAKVHIRDRAALAGRAGD